jgi:hypothetical protein
VQALLMIGIEVLLFLGVIHLWRDGLATVGDFILVQSYVIMAIDRLWDLGNALKKLYEAFADATEMVEILNTPHDITDAPNASTLRVAKGAIVFKDVNFSFNESRGILSDFNLEIPSHQKVALVGPSGAGKTTITKLMLRFYDVTSGGIYIDNQNIAKATQRSLRNSVAFVPESSGAFFSSGEPVGTISQFAVAENNSNVIYITTQSGVYKTSNGGGRWLKLAVPIKNQEVPFRAVAIPSGNDSIVFVSAGATIYKSLDGGSTFQTQGVSASGFVNYILVNGSLPQIAYAGIFLQ